MTPRFDPTRSVVFDLVRGLVLDDEGKSKLSVPADLLGRLLESAGDGATQDFGHGLGSEMGRRVAARLADGGQGSSAESWLEHLGGEFAVAGLGNARFERWGKGLVVRVEAVKGLSSALLAAVVEGALLRGLGRTVRVVAFEEEASTALLVLAPETAARAIQLKNGGSGLGSVVDALHQAQSRGIHS